MIQKTLRVKSQCSEWLRGRAQTEESECQRIATEGRNELVIYSQEFKAGTDFFKKKQSRYMYMYN